MSKLNVLIFTLQEELLKQQQQQQQRQQNDEESSGGSKFFLSNERLEQFRLELEYLSQMNYNGITKITSKDYQAILPALASGPNSKLPRLPQRARCVLLRWLRCQIEDDHRTTPGSYFDFPDSRTGVIQLASIPGTVWSSFQSYTFCMWIWFPRKINRTRGGSTGSSTGSSTGGNNARGERLGSSLETTLPQDALLFSLSTASGIGIECRMRETPSSTSRKISLELRSINGISTKTTALKTSLVSTAVQSNRWHLLTLKHSSLSSGDNNDLNSVW